MSFSVGASGVWKAALGAWIGVGGVWKSILNMHIGAGGAWKQWYAALSVSLSASLVQGNCQRTTAGSCSATTAEVLATVTGGSGSYTYPWAYVSGSNATVGHPHTNGAVFTRGGAVAQPSNVLDGLFRLTVTDTVTGASVTADVTARTRHTLII